MPRLCRVKADNFANPGSLHSFYFSSCEFVGGLLGWEMGSDDDDTWFALFVHVMSVVLDPNSCWFQMFVIFIAAGLAFVIGAYMRRTTILNLLRQKEEWVDKEKMLLNQLWAALEEKLESKSMLQEARVALDKVKARANENMIDGEIDEKEKEAFKKQLEEKIARKEALRIELEKVCIREQELRRELDARRESLRQIYPGSNTDESKYMEIPNQITENEGKTTEDIPNDRSKYEGVKQYDQSNPATNTTHTYESISSSPMENESTTKEPENLEQASKITIKLSLEDKPLGLRESVMLRNAVIAQEIENEVITSEGVLESEIPSLSESDDGDVYDDTMGGVFRKMSTDPDQKPNVAEQSSDKEYSYGSIYESNYDIYNT